MVNNADRIKQALHAQKAFFYAGKTKEVDFRVTQLKNLRQAILDNEEEILDALNRDMGKAPFEAHLTEITPVLEEIRNALNNVRTWAKPQKVKTPFYHFFSRSYIYPEPYGLTLILGPWNYPFHLIFTPLVGAMAAGNCAVLKPSSMTPHTSSLISRLVAKYFEANYVAVMEGKKEESQLLLKEKFDYIFFTGSVNVGKIVMKAAAEHLTPVTLELGGKSPCIIDEDAHISSAAEKIIWGKFINAGQTCIAPDYLYVHRKVRPQLMELMKSSIKKFYGVNPQNSPDYPRIINEKHFQRLSALLEEGAILAGGETDPADLYLAPTIVGEINWDNKVMQEEIFGPILPVLEYTALEEVIDGVNNFSKPLALYLFTNNSRTKKIILREISFGGGTINNIFMHFTSPCLPFGGVGSSGMGAYHGKASFDTFTHYKSILQSPNNFTGQSLVYPPYRKERLPLLKKIMRL